MRDEKSHWYSPPRHAVREIQLQIVYQKGSNGLAVVDTFYCHVTILESSSRSQPGPEDLLGKIRNMHYSTSLLPILATCVAELHC